MPAFLWTQKEDIGPSPRHGHAMCYDTARQRTLLFGGLGQAPLGDSWTWSGQNWTQVADTGASPRLDHAMCFDTARNVALLFGGRAGDQMFGDSWSWNGEYWTQVEDTGPAPRAGQGMAFDHARSRIVLFGGTTAANSTRDTWEWDGESWTQVEDTGPPPRHHHGMAYDMVRQRTLLFGGIDDSNTPYSDTWEWDGNAWTQIADTGPPPSTHLSMVSTDAQLILFGGLSNGATMSDDSWSLINGQWTQKQDMGPIGRWGHALAFDTQRRTIILFGGSATVAGNAEDLLRDTWEHLETESSPIGPPPPDGSQPSVVNLTLDPTITPPQGAVWAHVTLDQPAVDGSVLQLFWIPSSSFDPNNPQLDPSQLVPIGNYAISPGQNMISVQFSVPPINESVYIIATTGGPAAIAELTIA